MSDPHRQTTRITEISGASLMNALGWYTKNESHVRQLIALQIDGPAYPPSGSDRCHPELWKGAHWKWLKEKTSTRNSVAAQLEAYADHEGESGRPDGDFLLDQLRIAITEIDRLEAALKEQS